MKEIQEAGEIKKKNITEESIMEESIAEKDIIKESIAEKDITEESIVEKDIMEESIAEKDITEKNITEESITEKNITEENITEKDIAEESIIEENIIKEKSEAGQKNGADKTLLELSVGIVAWGLLCQLTVVWFVSDKAGYSLGLWIGTLLAVAAGVHMWWALDRALDFAQDTAVKMMTKHNILRYAAIVVVMALVMVSGFANPLAAFLGLMGLKVAAYLQPFTHKVLGYRITNIRR